VLSDELEDSGDRTVMVSLSSLKPKEDDPWSALVDELDK
jgi:hypothetical protein